MARGDYRRSAKVEKAAALEDHWVMVRRARDYARGHNIGAKKTVSTGLFPGVWFAVITNALNDKIKAVLGERYATDVLTKEEEQKLEAWIVGSARGKDPATNEDISDKVVLMLKARKADNRKRHGGPGTVKLTEAEDRLATARGAEVSLTWLANFAARHPRVRPMKERNADVTRTKKQNEGVVDKHFYGEYGVQASLEFHGKLDMEKKMIRDPRTIWWFDEMPCERRPRSSQRSRHRRDRWCRCLRWTRRTQVARSRCKSRLRSR